MSLLCKIGWHSAVFHEHWEPAMSAPIVRAATFWSTCGRCDVELARHGFRETRPRVLAYADNANAEAGYE